jgi:cytochrome P450
MVILLLGGANRDPATFPHPDRLDIQRPNSRNHVAFASGIHACVGAALARAEGITALRALFTSYPDLRLARKPQWRKLINLRGHANLPAIMHSDARRHPPAPA